MTEKRYGVICYVPGKKKGDIVLVTRRSRKDWIQGALIQEAIDVAVILNALRALRIDPASGDTAPSTAERRQEGALA